VPVAGDLVFANRIKNNR